MLCTLPLPFTIDFPSLMLLLEHFISSSLANPKLLSFKMFIYSLLWVLLPLFCHAVKPTTTRTSTITKIISSTSTPTALSLSYTSDKAFRSSVLNSTNFYRNQHNATALKWNDSLAFHAGHYAEKCLWKHSVCLYLCWGYGHRLVSLPNLHQGGPSGENLAVGYANITAVIEAWGDERKMYNFDRPTGFSLSTGHFTQLIWKNTNSVGCSRVDCDNSATDGASGWLVVCEYWPAGNVLGDFKNQVQKRIKEANGSGVAKGKHSVEWGLVVSGLVIALLVSYS